MSLHDSNGTYGQKLNFVVFRLPLELQCDVHIRTLTIYLPIFTFFVQTHFAAIKKKDSKYQRFAKRLYCGFSCDRDEIGEYYSEDWDIITKLKKCSTNYLLQ